MLTHLPPPDGCWQVRFDRYSPYFDQAEEYRLELRPLDFYQLTYLFPEADLGDLAYYFVDDGAGEYMIAAARWSQQLRDLVAGWRARWDGPERPSLRLERDADGAVIVDTRSAPRTIRLDSGSLALLEHLSRPARIDRVAGDLPGIDIDRALGALRAASLLFEEGDRAMSLVVTDSAVDPWPRPRRTVVGMRKLLPVG